MTVEEYAEEYGLNPETVRRYIRSGKIQARRVGRRYEIEMDDTNYNSYDSTDHNILQLIVEKDARIEQFERQSGQLEQQNNRLTQLLAMEQQNVGTLSQQLDRAHLQLEDMRQRRTVWQRIKAVFVAESA